MYSSVCRSVGFQVYNLKFPNLSLAGVYKMMKMNHVRFFINLNNIHGCICPFVHIDLKNSSINSAKRMCQNKHFFKRAFCENI
jgi:hypothetical protein